MKEIKKTMLTYTVIDNFEKMIDVNTLTEEQINKVEHYAYCACMGAKDAKSSWESFSELARKYANIVI